MHTHLTRSHRQLAVGALALAALGATTGLAFAGQRPPTL